MTREEAITVLKGLSENPLFSNQHIAAFNIAIHDIKAYHKWNLNELVLTQKDNEQEPILDKIRAEIEMEKLEDSPNFCIKAHNNAVDRVLQIIDKYKAETEAE